MALVVFTYFHVTELLLFDKLDCGRVSSVGWFKKSPPVAPCYRLLVTSPLPSLVCLLSWLSGHFITALGPFKLISLVPLVGELGNCLPEHHTERREGTVDTSREAVAELGPVIFSFSSAVVARGGMDAVLLLS